MGNSKLPWWTSPNSLRRCMTSLYTQFFASISMSTQTVERQCRGCRCLCVRDTGIRLQSPSLVRECARLCLSRVELQALRLFSYGGTSCGVGAVQSEKQFVTTLQMMPMVEGVAIPE